jgi:hypothetical protein
MQALAAGYSGYAGASCCCFWEKGFKNCLTNTFEKGCTSDAEVSDVQLSSPQPARRSVLTREICGLGAAVFGFEGRTEQRSSGIQLRAIACIARKSLRICEQNGPPD